MGKKKNLPAYDDWTAPWERNGTDFDEGTAKRFIYNLLRGGTDDDGGDDSAQVAQLQAQVEALVKERDTAKARVTELEDAQATDEAAKAKLESERQNRELRELVEGLAAQIQGGAPAGKKDDDKGDKGDKGSDGPSNDDLMQVAFEFGLSPKQAKRLEGKDLKELRADAREMYGSEGDEGDGDLDDGGDDNDFSSESGFGKRGQRMGYYEGDGGGEMPSNTPRRPQRRLGNRGGERSFDSAKLADELLG